MIARSRMLDWVLLLACNLIWGSQFVFLKVVQREMGPLFATLFPLALAMLVLNLIIRRQPHSSNSSAASNRMSRSDFIGFVLLGMLGSAAVALFGTWGVYLTLASNAALVALALPVTTAVMAYFILAERMTAIRAVSFALAIAGVLECSGINWKQLNFTTPQFLLGNSMCFVSVLGSAFYNVYSKKLLHRYSALRIVLYCYYGAFAVMLPVTIIVEPQSFRNLIHFSPLVWLGLVFLAILRNLLAVVIFLKVLERLDATVASLSNYLIPFFGVLTAGIFLHEHLTKFMILGGLLILASTLLMTVYEGRHPRVDDPIVITTSAPVADEEPQRSEQT